MSAVKSPSSWVVGVAGLAIGVVIALRLLIPNGMDPTVVYRSQRMLFPLIAGGLGSFPPGVVVWSMLITNLLAMGIGALVAAELATRWGASAWLGLAVPLNIGLIFELDIGGAGIVAYTFALAALLALVATRVWFASLLFAAAALSREVMVAFAVGGSSFCPSWRWSPGTCTSASAWRASPASEGAPRISRLRSSGSSNRSSRGSGTPASSFSTPSCSLS